MWWFDGQSMPIKDRFVSVLLLSAIIFLVYYDSFNNSFVYDDYPFVVENKAIKNLDIKSIVSNFTDRNSVSSSENLSKDVWRPLMTTSFAIDYKFWKLNPRFYHIENTAWHAANAALVYIITFLILNNGLAAFITSIVFAIHPVQTEAVTWISGRSNVLFLFFFLLSFIFHIRNKSRKSLLNCLCLISFTCSLLSKEMAIVLPLILILYDLHFSGERNIKYYTKYYFPFFLIAAFYTFARFSILGVIAQKEDWWGGGISYNLLTMLKAVAAYIRLLLLPINLKVGYLIDIPKSILDKDMIIAISILFSTAIAYLLLRKNKALSFYMLWFFISLVPVYNIVPFKAVMAERFLYLPLVGFASIFGIFFSKVKNSLKYILIFILIMYGIGTISRNVEWRDELTFYMQDAAHSPLNPKSHYNLGYAYAKEAEKNASSKKLSDSYYALAAKEFIETLRLKPDSQIAYVGLANAYNTLGLYDLAIKNFRSAVAIKEDSDTYNNLAVSYYRKGMYDESLKYCRRAVYLTPNHVNAYINLGNGYFMKREYKKAKMAWSQAFKLESRLPSLIQNIKDLEKIGY